MARKKKNKTPTTSSSYELKLDSQLIYAFVNTFLGDGLDSRAPTPKFHVEMWDMCCSDKKLVAIAAPRAHAKSTAISHSYTLANILFRQRDFIILVANTEFQASLFLNDIRNELHENAALKEAFGFKRFLKETDTDIIGEFTDGAKFRVIAKGSEQQIRGLKWRNKRPNLIVGDDLENDETVLSKERREKFRSWFYSALLPCLSDTGIVRIVGTILHLDALLERLLNDGMWLTKRYKAHSPDFKEILWPEKFSKERLRDIRQTYQNQGKSEGYSCEYLNWPIDDQNAFFEKQHFLPIKDWTEKLNYYAAVDLAISESSRADFTVILIAGVNSAGKIKIVDVRRGRWNSLDIIDQLFSVQKAYAPELFTIEAGAIEKAITPVLIAEMYKRNVYLTLNPVGVTKDKMSRARAINARMRALGVEFDKDAPWYDTLEEEMLRFPRDKHDDQVDAISWLGLTLDKLVEAQTPEEIEEEDWQEEFGSDWYEQGRNLSTGY